MELQHLEINGNKYLIKVATKADKEGFIDLWKISFKDTKDFIDFFFTKRFFPEFSVCIEHKNKIVSAMQSMPLELLIRGKIINSSIVAGVCTHPDYRGQGLMKAMFKFYMELINEKNILAVTYKPDNLKTYASLSHYATTGNLKYKTLHAFPKIIGSPLHNEILNVSSDDEDLSTHDATQTYIIKNLSEIKDEDINKCFNLYKVLAPSYSGIVNRTKDNFILKIQDYASVNGKILIYSVDGHIQSYCCYFDTKEEIYAEEFLATTDNDMLYVLDRLHEIANGRKLTAKIPSNFTEIPESYFPDSDNVSFVDQNVLGVTRLAEFIKKIDFSRFAEYDKLKDFTFEITDPINESNTGIYDLTGEISKIKPFVKLDIGSFLQFACGYYSIFDFENYNSKNAKIIDNEIAMQLHELVPTAHCFIVDEY